MKEEFLHYIWRLRQFDWKDLKTVAGEKIEVIDTGQLNTNAGPDFLDARIRIGETLWAGNVEIHINASDWTTHGHQRDRAYDNVILHVVFDDNRPIYYKNKEPIPCLELRKRIPLKIFTNYEKLLNNEYWIPCQHQFHLAPVISRNLWLDRLMVERLEQRLDIMSTQLKANQYNWEESFYQFIATAFGLKVNVVPFERLARSLPLLLLTKHKSSLFQIEALLFGQAGLLEGKFEDDYPNRLKKEYSFLSKKYKLKPIAESSWKFLRMRPANFPSIRIAQFATLIYQSVHLFSKILASANVSEIENMFQIKLSTYWHTHYIFDRISSKRKKNLGKSAIHLLIINTIAPFLFLYGQEKANEKYKEKAFQLLEELKPESNIIIKKWRALGVKPKSAYQTQALLQLKNNYCAQKRCLNCVIGNAVLKGKTALQSERSNKLTL